ncbi:hypothetical protein BDV26DRAFT_284236 [Aspergillus bertholletiae]|uniref:Inclusion body clearance protein IML2 n=1 Tax=Aspergillus bertholletiae TaxID=1226010 RepID=A0A5N7AXB7_9EURO|nr:hypothetical protein BDV26DRAFT_284236 [Aspergillus bertholletiae]
MLKVGSWLYGKKAGANASTQSLDSLVELRDLEDAMRAATLILNDDVDGAEDGLSEGISSFHNLGRGVVAFIRATLGFEQEVMRQASERLNTAETSAASDQHKAQHNSHAPNTYHSPIYSPGTEFALCQAMAQLMSAVVGVLNESLTESIKGFYKMRKAYITLDGILKMEQAYMQSRSSDGLSPIDQGEATVEGKGLSQRLSDLSVSQDSNKSGESTELSMPNPAAMLSHDPDADIFKNQIDVFVHSGSNFCFGILLLVISMVPPAFSKLLSIIGFYGDKERGLRMLWQANQVPGDQGDVQGYPQQRLEALLAQMRQRFPKSQLWLLEESRMEGANKNLERSLELLCGKERSPLKQVEALRIFERSLNAMYLHKYELCAEAFLECVELNSWSRPLYYYIAGASHLSLYRSTSVTDPKRAKEHAEKATEYFRTAPTFAGKKRFMARQLPFDVFVARKIAKWEARAKEWSVPLVDAVGVDPVEEMIFFWNGHSRMTQGQLEESMQKLAWSESDECKMWSREGPEEKAILQLLRAAVLRAMRKHEEARKMLKECVLNHDKSLFTGHLKDNWVHPVAHFEMAANLWMERPSYIAVHDVPATEFKIAHSEEVTPLERQQVQECKEYLEKAARWESYELDARVGLKVTAAMEAVRKWESTHSTPTN